MRLFITIAFLALAPLPAFAASVYLEDLTWMEIRDRIKGGATTAIVPSGGTEQNGPHMVTGKHNVIVRYTAGEIAKKLGSALVAPVIAYVPEGRIEPPEGHMQFPGTLSVGEPVYGMVLEDAARSLKQHGFKTIAFIGDHGGAQAAQKEVAARLSRQWGGEGVTVIHVADYYANNGQESWAESAGIPAPDITAHAGIGDTSELMAIDAGGVRGNLRGAHSENDYRSSGAMGDSSKASVGYGKRLLALKVDAAVRQIKSAR